MFDEKPKCIHCGKVIHRTIFAEWWDIGEVAGWVCNYSVTLGPIQTYKKIRERHRKGIIDLTNHIAPPKKPLDFDGDAFL